MTIPDDAFRHVPQLKGKIADPATSFYRVTSDSFWSPETFGVTPEVFARNMVDPADRAASLRETMTGRLSKDLWIFAYGSLMWDPAFHFDEVRFATLKSFQRSFCVWIALGRGSPETPGLMLLLDHGGETDGLAFRIPADKLAQESEIIWQREMFMFGHLPKFVTIETPQGPLEALTFIVDKESSYYTGQLSLDEAAAAVHRGTGSLGTTFDYLENLLEHQKILGIEDQAMSDLLDRASAIAKKEAEAAAHNRLN